mgnify:CR=1 FL=1
MALSTTQKTIEQLLTGNRQYQIPDFQRPYVWEEQQAIALVNDLLDAWRTNDGDYSWDRLSSSNNPAETTSTLSTDSNA